MSDKPLPSKADIEREACRPTAEEMLEKLKEGREAERQLSQQIYAHGCVCPPGAERTCQGALCPRQKWIVT